MFYYDVLEDLVGGVGEPSNIGVVDSSGWEGTLYTNCLFRVRFLCLRQLVRPAECCCLELFGWFCGFCPHFDISRWCHSLNLVDNNELNSYLN